MVHDTDISEHAARLLLLCALTFPRAYETEKAAYLCNLSPHEAKSALAELELVGRVVHSTEGKWCFAGGQDGDEIPVRFAHTAQTGGVLPYCASLHSGNILDAATHLFSWAESQQNTRFVWALDYAVEEIVRTLLRAPLRDYVEQERSRFIELVIRTHSMADAQGLVPRQMRIALLKARAVAFMLHSTSYLYILDTILDVRKILLDSADIEPSGTGELPGKGHRRMSRARAEEGAHPLEIAPDAASGEISSYFLAEAMPYISLYKYFQGSTRQALDHFSLTDGQEQPVLSGAQENIIPWGAFSSAFAALAAVQSGDVALALSILKTCMNSHGRNAGCSTRSWLHAHLATVYLATGKPDEALEHVDVALSVSIAQNVQCWMAAYTTLTHYHVLCGRPRVAHRLIGTAVETAQARSFRWGYSSPWFLDMMYVFRCNDLPDLPGYALETELKLCADGSNPLLRAVANRIRGDMLLRSGAPLREVQPPLLRSRAFFKLQQLPAEKCKTCAVLAQACLAAGDQVQALRYAIEAWPCHAHFQRLGIYWSPELEKLLPATHGVGKTENDAGKNWRQECFTALLHLNPENIDAFPQEMLKCTATAFGAVRACLFDADEAGRPRMTHALNMTREQVFGTACGFPLYLVEECLEGVPVCMSREALSRPDTGEPGGQLACIPILDAEGRFFALYAEGNDFPQSEDVDDAFMLTFGEHLGILLRRWNEAAGRAQQTARLLAVQKTEGSSRTIIFHSAAMARVLEQADIVARSNASVLIYGESGVGKELVAQRIHDQSGRRGPFVAVNLSSLPEELFESEMQGYERGAFTGAFQRKIGLLEMADGGTLFIDEVPDISPRIQIKLLRTLQERTFMRLGSTRMLHSDFRLIVATNRNLFEEMRQGAFRNDLFYRICVVPLFIPALRERPEDIDALLAYYLKEFASRNGCAVPAVEPADAMKLCTYGWPGNIRELKNVTERAVIFAREGRAEFSFDSDRFAPQALEGPKKSAGVSAAPEPQGVATPHEMVRSLFSGLPSARELEKQYILTVLRMTEGKVSGKNGAAALLGMSRSTLYDKMRALKISAVDGAGGDSEA